MQACSVTRAHQTLASKGETACAWPGTEQGSWHQMKPTLWQPLWNSNQVIADSPESEGLSFKYLPLHSTIQFVLLPLQLAAVLQDQLPKHCT